jgi:autoinducer 2-degrading protein
MISLLITVEVNPARVEDFVKYITEEAADCLAKEPGCRQFTVSRSVDEPNIFTLAEFYDDPAALEAHRQTPHFLLFQERVEKFDLIVSRKRVLGEVIHP